MGQNHEPPQARVMHIIAGYWLSRALYLAARLKLADCIGEVPESITGIAAATGTSPATLRRLMRALAAHGIFHEEEDGAFTHTPLSDALRSGRPDNLRAVSEALLGHDHYEAWGGIESCLVQDGPAFDRIFGMPIFRYYAEHPEQQALFAEAMSGLTAISNAGVLDSYRFPPFRMAIDVGGGHGSLLSALLDRQRDANGLLFDLPGVIADAEQGEFVRRHNGRLRTVGGDFFQHVPGGGDLYLLKSIVHDWDDASAVRILSNVRTAMAPNGRLAIVEMVLPGRNEPHVAPLMDLNMMVLTTGRERTEAEYATLLGKAGFRQERVVRSKGPYSVVEAAPIE